MNKDGIQLIEKRLKGLRVKGVPHVIHCEGEDEVRPIGQGKTLNVVLKPGIVPGHRAGVPQLLDLRHGLRMPVLGIDDNRIDAGMNKPVIHHVRIVRIIRKQDRLRQLIAVSLESLRHIGKPIFKIITVVEVKHQAGSPPVHQQTVVLALGEAAHKAGILHR